MLDDYQAGAGGSSAAAASSSPETGPQMSQAALALNMGGLSYEEYFKKVDEMVELMRQHWRLEQRVKALKVAIQLAKLLADTSQMKLYARKFKLITDSLDEFGRLVHQRIQSIAKVHKRAADRQQQQRQSDSSSYLRHTIESQLHLGQADEHLEDEPHELAKDICRNWFLKVASIRELVPRFYIELAIMDSCDILFEQVSPRALADSIEEQFYAQTLRRLSRTAWGLGDALVALHARAYLCRRAERLIGWRCLTRESLLFEMLYLNLRSSAQLVGLPDAPGALLAQQQQQQQPQQKLLSRASTFNSTTTSTSAAGHPFDLSLYFDLLSGPMQSILQLVTMRCNLCEDEQEQERHFLENAYKRLGRWVDELLDDEQQQQHQLQQLQQDHAKACCSAFRRNVLLQSLLRALPSDIVASKAQMFNDKLVGGQRAWLFPQSFHSTNSAVSIDNCDKGDKGDRAAREALLIPSVYSTLTSFIIALDASGQFEAPGPAELKRSILESAEELLGELLEREHNRLSVGHLRSFKALVSYAIHYQEERLDLLLERFLARLKRGRQYVQHYAALLDTIKTLFTNRTRLDEFKRLFSSRAFCQLFELLRKDEHKQEASRWILETMRANMKLNYKSAVVNICDRLLMSFLVKVFETLNESLSPLTATDDICHLSQLIVFFVDRFELESASERLELYSRLRKCVSNLNLVLEHLIRQTLQLAPEHRKLERRRAGRQNFLNGCLAFALVTTPAVVGAALQLELYQLACEKALASMSLSLADYFMRQIVLTLSEEREQCLNLSCSSKLNKNPTAAAAAQQHNLTQITQNEAGRQQSSGQMASQRAVASGAGKAPNALLVSRLERLLCMLVEHQEHVDLKHKLALSELLRSWPIFNKRAELLQMSSRLIGPAAQFEPNEGFNNNAPHEEAPANANANVPTSPRPTARPTPPTNRPTDQVQQAIANQLVSGDTAPSAAVVGANAGANTAATSLEMI